MEFSPAIALKYHAENHDSFPSPPPEAPPTGAAPLPAPTPTRAIRLATRREPSDTGFVSMDKLQVLCFAGTYGLALLSDLSRVAFRAPARWYLTVALTLLAWTLHTLYLLNIAWTAERFRSLSVYESFITVAWLLAGVALYLIARAPRGAAVALFTLPLVIGLLTAAGGASRSHWAEWGGWIGFWGAVHGLFLLAGSAAAAVAFAAGLMYLAQSARLKRKLPERFGITLPSLELSERLNRGALTLAFPLLTCGIATGVALGLALRQQDVLRWTDPKIWSGVAMWAMFAVLAHARYRWALRGRKVMILTAVAFAFVVFAVVGVNLLVPTAHGVPSDRDRDRDRNAEPETRTRNPATSRTPSDDPRPPAVALVRPRPSAQPRHERARGGLPA